MTPLSKANAEFREWLKPFQFDHEIAAAAHRLYAAALAEERVWREEAEQNLQGAISMWRERAKLLAESVASGVIQTGNIHEATAITEAANHLEEIAMRLFDDTPTPHQAKT